MKKRLDPRRRARAAMESPKVDDYDTLMRVGNTYTVNIYDDRVDIRGHDFGPDVTLFQRSERRLIIRMGGYGFHAGRTALTPHEYARTEYWACRIESDAFDTYTIRVVSVCVPRNSKRVLNDWLAYSA